MATILLVDDDPLLAFVRISALGKLHHSVRRVHDAAEALCLIEQPDFAASLALVLLGHRRAGLGAPEFVAELHARIPALPIVVIGSGTDAEDDFRSSSAQFISADDDFAVVLRTIAGILNLAATHAA